MISERPSKLVAAFAILVGSIVLMVGVAVAGVQTVVLSPGAAAPTETVVVSGTSTGCDPGSIVNFFFIGPPFAVLGSTVTDLVTGDFSATVTVPADAPDGPNRIGAQCVGGSATVYVDFTVAPTTTITTSTTSTTTTSTTSAPPVTTAAPSESSVPINRVVVAPAGAAKPEALAFAG